MAARKRIPVRPILALASLALLSACATPGVPAHALRLAESTLEIRSLQTRKLEASSETAILASTVAVLQDMEFNIDYIEKPLGVISASKISDADDSGEKTGLFFLDLLCAAGGSGDCNYLATAKDRQEIMLTIVVLPSLERSGEYAVRATVQRVIFDKLNRVKILEQIDAPEIYQEIFSHLRQALLIESTES